MKMKLSTVLALATATHGLSFGWLEPEQNPLVGGVLSWYDKLKSSKLLHQAADFFDEPLRSVPEDVVRAWESVSEYEEDLKASMKLSMPKKSSRRSDDTWEYHVRSDRVPDHTLRAKQPYELGLDNVTQYTGYLDVESEDKHFFFWFFESRNDPENDPVILWLNGGPGCSSMTGLLFELGPSFIAKDYEMVYNPHAWNDRANVIFLDQPVNVGFSYSSNPVGSTHAAAKDVFAFLELFFEEFSEYANNEFHISGESYAGHYIPAFAREIVEHGKDKNFNLTSVLIGNGITDTYNQVPSYEGMACGEGGYPAVLDEGNCSKIHDMVPRCQRLVEVCYKYQNPLSCLPSSVYCERLMEPYAKTGLNMYDIRRECGNSSLCYVEDDWIEEYFNLEYVQEAIGAEVEEFVGCSNSVGYRFAVHGDGTMPFHGDVKFLLDNNIPVLIYAGDKDYICNWLGNYAWTHALEWSHHDEFNEANMTVWEVDGVPAGEIKSADLLTFLRLYDAGHMVPHDQPKNSLEMTNSWIAGKL